MRIVVLYHQNSEHTGKVLDYAQEYRRFKNKQLELLSLETMDGSRMAELYGVAQYPAILALSNDGSLQKMWQGEMLPQMSELDYYTQDAAGYITNHAQGFAAASLLAI